MISRSRFQHQFQFFALVALVIATVLCWPQLLIAQEKITPKIVTTNLKNPCGVAIRPVTGEIMVSDTGRGRVIQVDRESTREVIVEFPIEEFKLDRGLIIGPTSLIFRGRHILLVSSSGQEDGEDSISMFDLQKFGRKALKPEQAEKSLTLEASGDDAAEGDFLSMAMTRTGLFVSSFGTSEPGWVFSADLVLNDAVNFRRFIPTNKLLKTTTPGGIAVSPEGHLAIAQMGSRDKPGDSKLAFFSPAGELLDVFPTGLNDIVALAYGPKSKRLFALDFNWENPKKGGLYKLVAVDSKQGCEAELITKLERPTSMTFDQSGNLYITVCGLFESTGNSSLVNEELNAPGKLLLIPGMD